MILAQYLIGKGFLIMGVRTKVTDKGIVSTLTSPGDTTGNRGIGPGADTSQPTVSSSDALTPNQAGSLVLSSSAALTVPLPAAGLVPGSRWVFRVGSEHAHVLISGSAETTARPFTDGTDNGGQVALENVLGSSVVLMSDGANYVVLGNSGSLTLS